MSDTLPEKTNPPRFYIVREASGDWTWAYWRNGDPHPGVPFMLQTLAEARGLARVKTLEAREKARPKPRPEDPPNGELDFGKGGL
jgi:hypothetical protein